MGTLEYSSPEQAEGRFDIDTLTDVYSLGVLLHELLVGSPPFTREELLKASEDEMKRVIREVEPTTPSTRLSSSKNLPAIAANRHLDPTALAKALRGELDWIILKALSKEKNGRYETPTALADDIVRHLTDQPISAGKPSGWVRLRKFYRRNRGVFSAVSAVIGALALGVAISVWQAGEATREARRAEKEAARAKNLEADAKTLAASEQAQGERARQAELRFRVHLARQWVRLFETDRQADLTPIERDVFRDASSQCDPPLFDLLLEVVDTDEGNQIKFATRCHVLVRCVAKTDESVRSRMEKSLLDRYRASEGDRTRKVIYAEAVASLGGLSEDTATAILATVEEKFSKALPYERERFDALCRLMNCLVALPPSDATGLVTRLLDSLQSEAEYDLFVRAITSPGVRLNTVAFIESLTARIRRVKEPEPRARLVRVLLAALTAGERAGVVMAADPLAALAEGGQGKIELVSELLLAENDPDVLALLCDHLLRGADREQLPMVRARLRDELVAKALAGNCVNVRMVSFAHRYCGDNATSLKFARHSLKMITSKTPPAEAEELFSVATFCVRDLGSEQASNELESVFNTAKQVMGSNVFSTKTKIRWADILLDLVEYLPAHRKEFDALWEEWVEDLAISFKGDEAELPDLARVLSRNQKATPVKLRQFVLERFARYLESHLRARPDHPKEYELSLPKAATVMGTFDFVFSAEDRFLELSVNLSSTLARLRHNRELVQDPKLGRGAVLWSNVPVWRAKSVTPAGSNAGGRDRTSRVTGEQATKFLELIVDPLCYGAKERTELQKMNQITGELFVDRWQAIRFVREKSPR